MMLKFNFTQFLIHKAGLTGKDTSDIKIRARYGYLEGWVSVIINLVLFILKLLMGISTGSISIIADALHTVSDVGTSAVVIWGFKISKKPADEDHPFGHGRMEDIATLIIAVLVCVIGLEIFKKSVIRFSEPAPVKADVYVVLILTVSAFVKEWLARFSTTLAKKIDSSTLHADAWHHRGDAISTLLVIVAVCGSMFNMFKLDSIFGAVLSGYIIYMGFTLIKNSSYHLIGKAVDEQFKYEVKRIAQTVEGVEGVHDIIAHDYGNFKAISLHVEVDSRLDSIKAHQIATSVETQIAKNINSSPIVHIDLKKTQGKKPSKSFRELKKIIGGFAEILNFHGVELLSNESGDFLTVHIVISKHKKSKIYSHFAGEIFSRYVRNDAWLFPGQRSQKFLQEHRNPIDHLKKACA